MLLLVLKISTVSRVWSLNNCWLWLGYCSFLNLGFLVGDICLELLLSIWQFWCSFMNNGFYRWFLRNWLTSWNEIGVRTILNDMIRSFWAGCSWIMMLVLFFFFKLSPSTFVHDTTTSRWGVWRSSWSSSFFRSISLRSRCSLRRLLFFHLFFISFI